MYTQINKYIDLNGRHIPISIKLTDIIMADIDVLRNNQGYKLHNNYKVDEVITKFSDVIKKNTVGISEITKDDSKILVFFLSHNYGFSGEHIYKMFKHTLFYTPKSHIISFIDFLINTMRIYDDEGCPILLKNKKYNDMFKIIINDVPEYLNQNK